MDLKELSGRVPWITKEGYIDPSKLPIDGVLKQALSADDQKFREALSSGFAVFAGGGDRADG